MKSNRIYVASVYPEVQPWDFKSWVAHFVELLSSVPGNVKVVTCSGCFGAYYSDELFVWVHSSAVFLGGWYCFDMIVLSARRYHDQLYLLVTSFVHSLSNEHGGRIDFSKSISQIFMTFVMDVQHLLQMSMLTITFFWEVKVKIQGRKYRSENCPLALLRLWFLPCDALRCTVFVIVILSVCLSVCPSVCHTRGLCPHGSTYDHDFFTIW